MGTRGLILVKHKKQYKVAQYCQFDMYLRGQGNSILKFLSIKENRKALKKNLKHCVFVEPDSPHPEDCPYSHLIKDNEEKGGSLHRTTAAKVLEIIRDNVTDTPVLLYDDFYFIYDSLFCEYAYVIDFDSKTFEIYIGGNETPLGKRDRFYTEEMPKTSNENYKACKLLKSYKLKELPSEEEFLNLEKELYDDDEDEELY